MGHDDKRAEIQCEGGEGVISCTFLQVICGYQNLVDIIDSLLKLRRSNLETRDSTCHRIVTIELSAPFLRVRVEM